MGAGGTRGSTYSGDKITETAIAIEWLAELQKHGEIPSDIEVSGSRDNVRLGTSLARYVDECLQNGAIELATAENYLEVALKQVCSGQWEETLWWPEREEGVDLIGKALRQLAAGDRHWTDDFLMRFFDTARRNGRHACWLHLWYVMPTLQFLYPNSITKIWQYLIPTENWVLEGCLHKARSFYYYGLQAEKAGEKDKARELYSQSQRFCDRLDPVMVEEIRQGLERVAVDR